MESSVETKTYKKNKQKCSGGMRSLESHQLGLSSYLVTGHLTRPLSNPALEQLMEVLGTGPQPWSLNTC